MTNRYSGVVRARDIGVKSPRQECWRAFASLGLVFALILIGLPVSPPASLAQCQVHPQNVILLIGDGMGFEQVRAAGMFLFGQEGSLSFESMPYTAESTTYSANSSVTDSAAAATALATGFKVNNGVISQAIPGDGRELETALEYYKTMGKSVGLVSTTYMTHATPAAFGAHEDSRSNLDQIAADYMSQTRPNLLFGGGAYGMATSSASAAGYTVVIDGAEMQALDPDQESLVSGQFGSYHLPYEWDGVYGGLPHLNEMTVTALDILDADPDGFFLMVEGGRIDHAGHDNHIERNVWETVEFAKAAQTVLDWAAGRTDTLVVVTADHETGGLTVVQNNGQGVIPDVTWSTTGHTGANVPVYAWGFNAQLVSGVMDNTDLHALLISPGEGPCQVPAAPTALGAAAVSAGQIDTTWTDNATDETGFAIERSLDGSAWAQLDTVAADVTGYTDTGLAPSTTYYYRVYAYNDAGSSAYSNEADATTLQAQGSADTAIADYATTYGTASDTYQATGSQDDIYQSFIEAHSGGKPVKRHDRLEHIWAFDVTGGNHVLNADAHRDEAGDADSGFDFSWSASPGGPWVYLLTVVRTMDDDSYQAADLVGVSQGTIYIRVTDNNRDPGENRNDTLHVDHLYLDGGTPPTEPPGAATNPNPADDATGVTTAPLLSWTAGPRTVSHDVYFGESTEGLLFQGNQTIASFNPGALYASTTYRWRIDEVNEVGTTTGTEWSFKTRSASGPTTVHVHSIVLDTVRADPPQSSGRATVTVVDELGAPVELAEVAGSFDGAFLETVSATTDAYGVAVLTTGQTVKKPVFAFCIQDVTFEGLDYAPGDNEVSCASYP